MVNQRLTSDQPWFLSRDISYRTTDCIIGPYEAPQFDSMDSLIMQHIRINRGKC